MSLRAVGILSPGEMGAAIGALLHAGGLEVVTCLAGRGDLTRQRAQEAGIRDAPTFAALVGGVDLLLSVLPPAEALPLATRVAAAMARSGATPVYVDCNAVAPATATAIAAALHQVGAPFIDAGIIGPPPRPSGATRFYCSGPDTAPFEQLRGYGLDVRVVGPAIGQASGLKMVYAASTKGTTALWTELLVAARALGLQEALQAELGAGRSSDAQRHLDAIPSMPRRARRWVGEMEEIAATFAALGLTPAMLDGAAEIYRMVGETPLADQSERDPNPSLDTIVDTLAARLRPPAG